MSEPIPDSIPTSTSRLSQRPTKRSRPSNGMSAQSHSLAVLFANADREITIPAPSTNTPSAPAPPPEIVPNVQGSSAGAGSGEFHVYKASRRREYERLKAMDEEVQKEDEQREWERRKAETEEKEKKRMSKNKSRREKAKERKKGTKRAISEDSADTAPVLVKKGLGARKDVKDDEGEVADEAMVNENSGTGLMIHDEED